LEEQERALVWVHQATLPGLWEQEAGFEDEREFVFTFTIAISDLGKRLYLPLS
jgi:hypothetical protein